MDVCAEAFQRVLSEQIGSGQVENAVRPLHCFVDDRPVQNISFQKVEVSVTDDILQILQTPGREIVQNHYLVACGQKVLY